jgi:hypothetical protein
MTNLEALQSLVEYRDNEDRFIKALLDQSVNPYDTYTADNKSYVDLAAVDIVEFLLAHPKFKEGDTQIEYDTKALASLRDRILSKYDAQVPTINGDQPW